MPCKSILLVDDDQDFSSVLARALTKRGFHVSQAHDLKSARSAMNASIDYAIVDMSLRGESGLNLIEDIKSVNPASFILLFTGYASIATAVAAMKMGADNYLPKPADVDSIVAALGCGKPVAVPPVPSEPLALDKLEWEQIQRILHEHGGNISAAARALQMHRRTLQRKLSKPPSLNRYWVE